jgi:nicotinamide-nucleotide adenylyltransferase
MGHLKVVYDIVKEADYLVIAMGSAQLSHLKDNPFTAGERYEMIFRTLNAEAIENFHIIPIDDLNIYPLWVAHVVSHSPKFEVVYAHNPLSIRLFKESGYEVVKLELHNPDLFSGTEIRRRMASGEKWRGLVPKEVGQVIDEINGVERIKELFK